MRKRDQNIEKLVLSFVFLGASLWISSSTIAQERGERKRDNNGAYLEPGNSYRNIAGIPIPISRGDIERWSQMMFLSESQNDNFRILHNSYIDQEAKVHWQYIQPLWNHSADIMRRGSPATNVVLAEEFTSLIKTDRPRGVKILVRTEDRLFSEFELFLNEDQLPLLKQVRSQRERQRYNRRKSRYPGGDVDLPLLLWKLYGVDLDLTGEQLAAMRTLNSEYDESITPLFKKRLEAILNISIKASLAGTRLRSLGQTVKGTDRQSRAGDLRSKRKRFNRKLVSAEKRIHDQNVRYLDAMIEILPEAQADGLVGAFNQLVYNSIYPDPTDTTILFEAVFAIDDLTTQQRQDLSAIEIMIQSQQAKLCNQMVRRFLEWRELQGIEWGFPAGALNEYENNMADLHVKRKENAQFTITLINATILPEQRTERLTSTAASLVKWMEEYVLIPDKRLSRR